MTNKYMKRCSVLLITKGMKIKTTVTNANQNYNDVSPHTSQNGVVQVLCQHARLPCPSLFLGVCSNHVH